MIKYDRIVIFHPKIQVYSSVCRIVEQSRNSCFVPLYTDIIPIGTGSHYMLTQGTFFPDNFTQTATLN